jgi:hypothetical protein
MKILDIDMHRRKWSVIISGLPGQANEKEVDTRLAAQNFAIHKLKITDADSHMMGACHRLSKEENAPILARFLDLDNRNKWLSSAKNLKGSGTRISISPDMCPALRPLKKNIMQQRKALKQDGHEQIKVKYHPSWPYISLSTRGHPSIVPALSKKNIISNYLGLTQ